MTTNNRASAPAKTNGPLETFRIAFPYIKLFVWNNRIDYKFDEEMFARKAATEAEKLISELSLPLSVEVDKRFQWGNEWIIKIILNTKKQTT